MPRDPRCELDDVPMWRLHELHASVRLTPTAHGWRLTTWAPLMVLLWGGVAAVFLFTAVGFASIQMRYVAPLAIDGVIFSAVLAVPGLASAAIAIWLAAWRRRCEVDASAARVTIDSRWLFGSSQITMSSDDVRIEVRRYRSYLSGQVFEGHVVVIDAPGVRPMIIACGKEQTLKERAHRLAEQLGLRVG